jgi:putative aminopeptidase FrvX
MYVWFWLIFMYDILKQLTDVHAPSGNEIEMTKFILNYIERYKTGWNTVPRVHFGGTLQDAILLVFGTPKTALFAHMDSIGYTVRYGNELVKIGGPHHIDGTILTGKDSKGAIECKLRINEDENKLWYEFDREIDRGTDLVYKSNFREDDTFIQSPYLDNRMGVLCALKVAEQIKDGIICFSTYEEHGGGGAEFIGRVLYEKYHVHQAIISDITWVTNGVKHGEGVAISMRDSGIPRRSYVNRVIEIAKRRNIKYQLEVESSGGSDGNSLQRSPYPFDWCFVGAPSDYVHTANERVHKKDFEEMIKLHIGLMYDL